MSGVSIIQLPELCPVAMEALDSYDNQDDYVAWLEEHAKTCEACKGLIELLTTVMTGNPPPT